MWLIRYYSTLCFTPGFCWKNKDPKKEGWFKLGEDGWGPIILKRYGVSYNIILSHVFTKGTMESPSVCTGAKNQFINNYNFIRYIRKTKPTNHRPLCQAVRLQIVFWKWFMNGQTWCDLASALRNVLLRIVLLLCLTTYLDKNLLWIRL